MKDDNLSEITSILNDPPTLTQKVKRALLREKFKLSETTIDELAPMNEVTY